MAIFPKFFIKIVTSSKLEYLREQNIYIYIKKQQFLWVDANAYFFFVCFMQELEKSKPVILTGDLNCAHQEIDIFNPAVSVQDSDITILVYPFMISHLAYPKQKLDFPLDIARFLCSDQQN